MFYNTSFQTHMEESAISILKQIQILSPRFFISYSLASASELSFDYRTLESFLLYVFGKHLLEILDRVIIDNHELASKPDTKENCSFLIQALIYPMIPPSIRLTFSEHEQQMFANHVLTDFLEACEVIQKRIFIFQNHVTECYHCRMVGTLNNMPISLEQAVQQTRTRIITQMLPHHSYAKLDDYNLFDLKQNISLNSIVAYCEKNKIPISLSFMYLLSERPSIKLLDHITKLHDMTLFTIKMQHIINKLKEKNHITSVEAQDLAKMTAHQIRHFLRHEKISYKASLLYAEKYFFTSWQLHCAMTNNITIFSSWIWEYFIEFFCNISTLMLNRIPHDDHTIITKIQSCLSHPRHIINNPNFESWHHTIRCIAPNFTEYFFIHDDKHRHEALTLVEQEKRLSASLRGQLYGGEITHNFLEVSEHTDLQKYDYLFEFWLKHYHAITQQRESHHSIAEKVHMSDGNSAKTLYH
ncbi:MAG: hypothetical protein FJ161_04625 [Gammaproteobacteria bacterium]|nr:hypothetical protein [Gammaproteobacteria bacterium]